MIETVGGSEKKCCVHERCGKFYSGLRRPLKNIAAYSFLVSSGKGTRKIFLAAVAVGWNRPLKGSHIKINLMTVL